MGGAFSSSEGGKAGRLNSGGRDGGWLSSSGRGERGL